MNDRALRHAVIGLGGPANGVVREERWVIIPASEVMAIVALAHRAARISSTGSARSSSAPATGPTRSPVRARDLKAAGAMALLLKDAIRPNLVQTLEGGPAIVHAGPFGNIAHGCNSILATRAGLALGDVVVTEAGFGSDLGAEKFFDIKCRVGGLNPEAAVLVATVRSLKMQGGADKRALGVEDLAGARARPAASRAPHPERPAVRRAGRRRDQPLHRRHGGRAQDGERLRREARRQGRAVRGVGEGRRRRRGARRAKCSRCSKARTAQLRADLRRDAARAGQDRDDRQAACTAATAWTTRRPPRARSTTSRASACSTRRSAWRRRSTRSPTIRRGSGKPTGFRITVSEVYGSAGAGFVVAKTGDIMTMPGLPKVPAAEGMTVKPNGDVVGLS